MLLSYAGFVTYLLFPAAPPWLAYLSGYDLGGPVLLAEWSALEPGSADVPQLMEQLRSGPMMYKVVSAGPNPVAAMPSLHAAYPFYIALFGVMAWGWRSTWLFLLPIAVTASTVYLGHHYVVDGLAGFAYAAAAFFLVQAVARRWGTRQ
jgi:membrane-associated phospholipid phosphatase